MLVVFVLTFVIAILVFLIHAPWKNKVIAETGGSSIMHILDSRATLRGSGGQVLLRESLGGVFLLGGFANLSIFIVAVLAGRSQSQRYRSGEGQASH
jgi:hypothetical protein